MRSRWSDRDAGAAIERYGEQGVPPDLALRTYTTRLLGGDPALVLHGGGNTSVKLTSSDLFHEAIEVIHVKGSGWNMGTIEPAGLPAVRLDPLRRVLGLEALSDEAMVNFIRGHLLDAGAPTPSVETLLHAFIPHKFVDHTHATAILALTDQPEGESLAREVFGERVACVPYVLPGFALAKRFAGIYSANPAVEGAILLRHGIFSFGADARTAYERMIELVTLAEARLKQGKRTIVQAVLPSPLARVSEIAPVLRGACAIDAGHGLTRQILSFRQGPAVLRYVNGAEVARYSQQGVATPDHAIRTKGWPLLVPPPESATLAGWGELVRHAVGAFVERYRRYFALHNARSGNSRTELDPYPRVVLVPGIGLFGLGRSAAEASIAADLAESTVEVVTNAESMSSYQPISEADQFDVEYWSLEQAKLSKAAVGRLAGQIAVITGAGSGIGAATARAMAKEGAEVVLLDRDPERARSVAAEIGRQARALECDVTIPESVAAAFAAVVEALGGVDIVVSNAGAAWEGRIGEVDESILRRSFELNFFAHQQVAQNAVRIMRAQGTGGCLLFNASKQAVNPGKDFGPYGLPKASTLFLMKQYALDYGSDGIRANAVNADRVRTGMLTDDLIASRSRARGISESEYLRGNLLRREVLPEDVADAFVFLATARKTTAAVVTVDGGNIEASLR